MKEYSRSERISSQIHRELTQLIKYSLKDPRIGEPSLLDVKVSKDLSIANVYFGLLDTENSKESEQALNRSAGYLQRELGKMLKVRSIPHLRFHYDDTEVKAIAMDALIASVMEKNNSESNE